MASCAGRGSGVCAPCPPLLLADGVCRLPSPPVAPSSLSSRQLLPSGIHHRGSERRPYRRGLAPSDSATKGG